MSISYILRTEDILQNTLRVSTLHYNHSKLKGSNEPISSHRRIGLWCRQWQICDTLHMSEISIRDFTNIMQSNVTTWHVNTIGLSDGLTGAVRWIGWGCPTGRLSWKNTSLNTHKWCLWNWSCLDAISHDIDGKIRVVNIWREDALAHDIDVMDGLREITKYGWSRTDKR